VTTEVSTILHGGKPVEKGKPGGLLAVETDLDPALAKSDGLSGNMLGLEGELPETSNKLEVEIHLMDRLIGAENEKEIENIKENEALMLNVGTGKSAGIVTKVGKTCEVDLKVPVCAEDGDRIAISRQIGSRWRLIGHGRIVSRE
ncbi:MAG: translation initiation factor IF-2 subunit gamma, partial [Candidatus Aenigmatarchaeota archaeon]